jgi:hypothetical protein
VNRKGEPAWTFYGREGCPCCEEAANLLLLLLDGRNVTVRMIDLASPAEGPAMVHRLPALLDEGGHVVFQGAFDSRATELAWREAAQRRPRAAREAFLAGFAPIEPLVNGLQP